MLAKKSGPIVMASLAMAALTCLALADKLPNGGSYDVKDNEGHEIGDGLSSSNIFIFNDNPNQNHPPNTSSTWVYDSTSGGYSNGSGHYVFFAKGEFNWSWAKYDGSDPGTSTKLDDGTMTPGTGQTT